MSDEKMEPATEQGMSQMGEGMTSHTDGSEHTMGEHGMDEHGMGSDDTAMGGKAEKPDAGELPD